MSDLTMIRAAAERLKGHARVTPLLNSAFLDEIAGRRVFVKVEALQHTGSFKFRGAWSAVSALSEAERSKGILAFSSGNHAQGVAMAARSHGVPCVIIMPADAPRVKIENTRALGAEVVLYDRDTEDRDAIGARLTVERGMTLVKPFDEPLVIAGQGTCGLEIAAQAAELGVTPQEVLVCCGGGGLPSGIALALEARCPVQPFVPWNLSFSMTSLAALRRARSSAMRAALALCVTRSSRRNLVILHFQFCNACAAPASLCPRMIACGQWRWRGIGSRWCWNPAGQSRLRPLCSTAKARLISWPLPPVVTWTETCL